MFRIPHLDDQRLLKEQTQSLHDPCGLEMARVWVQRVTPQCSLMVGPSQLL